MQRAAFTAARKGLCYMKTAIHSEKQGGCKARNFYYGSCQRLSWGHSSISNTSTTHPRSSGHSVRKKNHYFTSSVTVSTVGTSSGNKRNVVEIAVRAESAKRQAVPVPPWYTDMCRKHPYLSHKLEDHQEAPVELAPCPFCGGIGIPWVSYDTGYFIPGYYIRCSFCGAKSRPESWGVGVIYPPEDAHRVTEPEALENACVLWNTRAN